MSTNTGAVRVRLDAQHAADQLGVSRGMVYKLIKKGELDGYDAGVKRVVYEDSVLEYQERRRFKKKPDLDGVRVGQASQEPGPESVRSRLPGKAGKRQPVTAAIRHLRLRRPLA